MNKNNLTPLNNISYRPINPFICRSDIENFPRLTDSVLAIEMSDDEDEEIEEEEIIQEKTIDLNLSIDTLAKIKPADISNLSEFLIEKEREEQYEERFRDIIDLEDEEYFKNKKEELSPQSKHKKAIILYNSDIELEKRQIGTPHRVYKMEPHDNFSPFQSPPPNFLSPIMNRRDDLFFSPKERSPLLFTPKTEIDLSFISPIRSENNSKGTDDLDSPLISPKSKLISSISSPKGSPEEDMQKKSVAKRLNFLNEEDDHEDLQEEKISTENDEGCNNNGTYQSFNLSIPIHNNFSNNITHTSFKGNDNEEKMTPKRAVSFRESNKKYQETSTSTHITSRSIGTQTLFSDQISSLSKSTKPSLCSNCQKTCETISLLESVDCSVTTNNNTENSVVLSTNNNTRQHSTSSSSRYRREKSLTPTTTTSLSYHHSHLRYNYSPSVITPKILTSSPTNPTSLSSPYKNDSLVLKYRRPLSPGNYALLKQRYKTHIRYLDKYNNRSTFHLA
ncbi:hypothetical protein ABK040_005485 [Willaertia magna]